MPLFLPKSLLRGINDGNTRITLLFWFIDFMKSFTQFLPLPKIIITLLIAFLNYNSVIL